MVEPKLDGCKQMKRGRARLEKKRMRVARIYTWLGNSEGDLRSL
jgi:hypothetical protein